MAGKGVDELAILSNAERAAFKAALAAKDKQLDHLQERIDKLRTSRWSIPTQRKSKAKSDKPFVRVVIPDTHGTSIDVPAITALFDDLEALRPKEIVMLGDHLECGGFLAQHHTLGYVAQSDYTFEADVDAANDLIDKLQARCPDAVIHYIEGNHERRIETWCITQALRNQADGGFLLKQFGTRSQLHLDKRGIHFYKQGQKYMNVKIPGTIKLGSCYFTHGHTSAKHSAAVMVQAFGANVVFGHIHRPDEFSMNMVDGSTARAWCPGCLCDDQPKWRHTAPTSWSHGYATQLVHEDDFLHINVPIIEGKSYLVPFTQSMGVG
jgi:predicted phosphodiesterase